MTGRDTQIFMKLVVDAAPIGARLPIVGEAQPR